MPDDRGKLTPDDRVNPDSTRREESGNDTLDRGDIGSTPETTQQRRERLRGEPEQTPKDANK